MYVFMQKNPPMIIPIEDWKEIKYESQTGDSCYSLYNSKPTTYDSLSSS